MPKVTYCACGQYLRKIDGKLMCPKHLESWKPFGGEKREKVGKYSGFSKNQEYGKNWR